MSANPTVRSKKPRLENTPKTKKITKPKETKEPTEKDPARPHDPDLPPVAAPSKANVDPKTVLKRYLAGCPSMYADNTKKVKMFTHTSLSPNQSYYIPDDKLRGFYKIYESCIRAGHVMSFTEKHRDKIAPILIDIDLRYSCDQKSPVPVRHHTIADIERFIYVYSQEIALVLDVKQDDLTAFIFERRSGYVSKPKNDKEAIIKDGIHIIFPFVVTNYATQYYLREKVIQKCDQFKIFFNLPLHFPDLQTGKQDDSLKVLATIIDKAVVEKNNWYMYGSVKPNLPPYVLTRVIRLFLTKELCTVDAFLKYIDARSPCQSSNTKDDVSFITHIPVSNFAKTDLVPLFSIRIVTEEDLTPIIHDAVELKSYSHQFEYSEHRRVTKKTDRDRSAITGTDSESAWGGEAEESTYNKDLGNVVKLMEGLSVSRASDYNKWMEVGWCLHSLAFSTNNYNEQEFSDEIKDVYFELWNQFSAKSPKYDGPDYLRVQWNKMRPGKYSIGTLYGWLKEDNFTMFREITQETVGAKISSQSRCVSYVVAKNLHAIFGDEFVCSDFKEKKWHMFQSHRWQPSSGGVDLRKKLSNQLVYEYQKIANFFGAKGGKVAMSADQKKQNAFWSSVANLEVQESCGSAKQLESKEKNIGNVIYQLEDTTFKNKVMTEAAEIFHNANFLKMLNSKHNLIGFNNGVYDLDTDTFRNGKPSDFVTLTTGYDYRPLDLNSDADRNALAQCEEFIRTIFTDPDLRYYMKKVLGSCLHGDILVQAFYVWTGSGGNGKGILIELLKHTLGEYVTSVNVTMLTGKRTDCVAANPELYQTNGVRFVHVDEPENNATLNTGLIKNITGGEEVKVRTLYGEPIQFKPQFALNMLCNAKPKLPDANDGGLKRRLRIVPFNSKFVMWPNKNNPLEFKIDYSLQAKLPTWKFAFFHMLKESYKLYMLEGLQEPDIVLRETDHYFKSNDIYTEFTDDVLKERKNGTIRIRELYDIFTMWFSENHSKSGESMPTKAALKDFMDSKYKAPGLRATTYYKGWAIDWAPTDRRAMAANLMSKAALCMSDNEDDDPENEQSFTEGSAIMEDII